VSRLTQWPEGAAEGGLRQRHRGPKFAQGMARAPFRATLPTCLGLFGPRPADVHREKAPKGLYDFGFTFNCLSMQIWYARVDSNHWPFAPEANALSRLSYGRMKLRLRRPVCSSHLTRPGVSASRRVGRRQKLLNPLTDCIFLHGILIAERRSLVVNDSLAVNEY
jgi:hypothetical protein